MRLQDQVAIVTGGGRNIGEAICRLCAEEGAKVAVVGRDDARGRTVADSLNALRPGSAMNIVCDVTSAPAVDAMVQAAVERFGGVDILVNNAAWTDHKTLLDLTDEEWDAVMDVSLRGVWYCSRAVARSMIAQRRRGRIINIASTSGHWGRKNATAYPAAKAAVISLTKSMALQLGPSGIRVNSISPNRIGSPVGEEMVPPNRPFRNLAGRPGSPVDVARAAVFLASGESDFIHAIDLPVDGGALAVRE